MSQDNNHSSPSLEEQYQNGTQQGKVLAYLAVKPVITGISDDYKTVQVIARKRDTSGNFFYEEGQKLVRDIIADLDQMSNNYTRIPLNCKNIPDEDLQEHFEHLHGILYLRTNVQKSIDALNSAFGQRLTYLPHLDTHHADDFKQGLKKEFNHFNNPSVKAASALNALRTDSVMNAVYDRSEPGENKTTGDVSMEIATSAVWTMTKNAFPRN